jgi:eukaryotic-like serine/threonine-protein kinase
VSVQFDRLQAALNRSYRLERELGQGGMATVYLAEDLRHHRKVALKVLRPELAATMGPERFAREIEVAARLQHPHILGLLDSGDVDGFFYYVMPYVEGETLRDRLARSGELPVHEAVRLLGEIADALAVAHQQGVVHRDIKPENVLLSGRHAMVMDFGVAKAVTEASGRQQLTTAGVALGTPAYMAPEQATADPQLDGRVDIYALGVVGYEMLTGHPPFHGLNPQQTLAAHVTQSPAAVGLQRPGLSPALEAVIMRCLAKRPADRYQTADELVAVLEPLATPSGGMTPTHTQPVVAVRAGGMGMAIKWFASAAAVLLIGIGALFFRRHGETPMLSLTKFTRLTSAPGLEILPALSPDGKFLAYTGVDARTSIHKIYLRATDGGGALAITDSLPGDQSSPDWSPDGRLVFASVDKNGGSIVIMSPTGGSVRIAYRVPEGRSVPLAPRWSPDGRQIAFEQGDSALVINQDGAGLRLVAELVDVHSLVWSPDGRWLAGVRNNSAFVYGNLGAFGNLAASTVFVVPASGGAPRMVSDSTTLNISPIWLRNGSGLLYVSNGGGGGRDIYQQQIGRDGRAEDPARRITTGLDAHTIALSRDGRRMAYSKYNSDVNIWMVQVPPGGSASVRSAVPITRGNQTIEQMRISPDGESLAYDSDLNGNADIFVVRADGGTPRQMTDNPSDDLAPDWSPDGTQLAFHSFRTGNRDIFTMNADGTGLVQITSDPVHERFAIWGTNNTLAYARDSARALAVEEVTRATSSEPWGRPKWLANVGNLTGTTSNHSSYLVIDPKGRPAMVASGGGPLQPILHSDKVPAGSYVRMPGDGRTLYFFSKDSIGAFIGAADLSRGTIRKVVTFDEPGRENTRGVFDTDGSRFYVTFGDHEADIYVAEVEQR